ncbi:MAG: osmotically inducible protein OsmC [Bacteroidetes bacterium GWF2_49_14]|nr:MAG: osmotically inducible protein OsmC [Bacteroidetes bacterium GWF2_49_14]HBB91795.1 osmotically inducible protein OsmC [Bacteroidales bacterium]
MATVTSRYLGELRTENVHLQSGEILITDAPLDNQGLGRTFSPTDLAATALGDCIMTVMGIAARARGISIDGTTYEITKVMADSPRRIGEIHVVFTFPSNSFTESDKRVLEAVHKACPVALSLHPDINQVITYNW